MEIDWEKLTPIIAPAIIALIGGLIGYFSKYYLDKKAKFSEQNSEIKREAYAKFVSMTVNFFIASKKAKRQQQNVVDDIGKFYKQYVLYGSPKVVKAFANFMQIFYLRELAGLQDKELTKADLRYMLRSITKVYAAMRKDIGLSNLLLGRKSAKLMRGIIKDYDVIMVPKYILWWKFFTLNIRSNSSKLHEGVAKDSHSSDSNIEAVSTQEPPRQNREQRRKKERKK